MSLVCRFDVADMLCGDARQDSNGDTWPVAAARSGHGILLLL